MMPQNDLKRNTFHTIDTLMIKHFCICGFKTASHESESETQDTDLENTVSHR